jgi:hypothetical protein
MVKNWPFYGAINTDFLTEYPFTRNHRFHIGR